MTPESIVQKSIVDYLRACHLGVIRRVNAGVAKVGNAPTHPWAKDTRRRIQLAEAGHSDLVVELDRDTRNVFIEVKSATGRPTALQLQFLARQRERGHVAFIARSPWDVYEALTEAGFKGLPVPHKPRKAPEATR